MKNNAIDWYQTADAGIASGDVVIAPSANGFKMYVYYYDHNSGVIGGYATDCIADWPGLSFQMASSPSTLLGRGGNTLCFP